jgi:hypothetical protein
MRLISEQAKVHLDLVAAQEMLKAARASGDRQLIQKATAVMTKADKMQALAAIHFRR